jgi:hypothetical protein
VGQSSRPLLIYDKKRKKVKNIFPSIHPFYPAGHVSISVIHNIYVLKVEEYVDFSFQLSYQIIYI